MKTRRLLACGAAALTLLVATPSAWAHVTVNPNEAEKGGFAKLSFRMPTERDDASSTKLEVQFPTDPPFASVGVKPHQGWTYTVEKTTVLPFERFGEEFTEAVSKITWTGGAVKPGEFEEFDVSLGPLPDKVDSLEFKALQTYDSGEVVRWIEEATDGGEEPEHPAPVLTLVDAPEEDGDSAGGTPTDLAAQETSSSEDDSSSDGLAIAALVVGGLGLIVGGVALARGRRSVA
jgi:periplasmic copper chaperone A